YNSLGVPIGSTVQGIQIMKDLVKEQVAVAGITNAAFVDEPFDYITRELSEIDV
ncbi:MAG: allophycocyanin subunit beta, partial [Dolichospermum sp.]